MSAPTPITPVTPVTRSQRAFFAAVGILALWVGLWGTFSPTEVARAIPWSVPPLHARVVGAIYLSAVALMVGGMLSRNYCEARVAVRMIAIWPGLLFLISLFYLDTFDFRRQQVWIWFGAYVVYPLIALRLMWWDRMSRERSAGPLVPAWARGYLLAQGIVVTLLALALLIVPGVMRSVWPWKISQLLAQIYSGPLLAYGIGSLMVSRERAWPEVRVVVVAAFALALGVLVASWIHRGLFVSGSVATVLWFGGFSLATAVLGLLTVRGLRVRASA